jgi:hypothetical protein
MVATFTKRRLACCRCAARCLAFPLETWKSLLRQGKSNQADRSMRVASVLPGKFVRCRHRQGFLKMPLAMQTRRPAVFRFRHGRGDEVCGGSHPRRSDVQNRAQGASCVSASLGSATWARPSPRTCSGRNLISPSGTARRSVLTASWLLARGAPPRWRTRAAPMSS